MAVSAAALESTKQAPAASLMGAQDTVSASSEAFHVFVTVCDFAGKELLCNVSLVVSLQTSVGDFAKAIVDKLAPAPKGCYFEFTSYQFSGALTENQVSTSDPDAGITKKNEKLLSTICSSLLHPGEQWELESTIVQTELSVIRREETDAYMRLLQQTRDDRVYHWTAHDFANYADAVGYWETRRDDLARTRMEELDAFRLCTEFPGNNRDNRTGIFHRVLVDSSFLLPERQKNQHSATTYVSASERRTGVNHDVVKCIHADSENLCQQLCFAEYVCPYAFCPSAIPQNRMQSCPCKFKRREDLLEHLQSVHRNDKIKAMLC